MADGGGRWRWQAVGNDLGNNGGEGGGSTKDEDGRRWQQQVGNSLMRVEVLILSKVLLARQSHHTLRAVMVPVLLLI